MLESFKSKPQRLSVDGFIPAISSVNKVPLQAAINKAVVDYNATAGSDQVFLTQRDTALTGLALIPLRLCGLDTAEGLRKAKKPETDTDTLLAHSAAGIAACWHLRRGKDLKSAQELISLYVPILQPLLFTQSEAHRKAAATLLNQSFMLKGSLARSLYNSHQAIVYNEQAIQYGIIADDTIAQALAHRMQCVLLPEELRASLGIR